MSPSSYVLFGMLACALILTLLAWRDPDGSRSVRAWALAGTLCLLLLEIWTTAGLPFDVTRFQWAAHVARAGLLVIGFCALLRSVFLDLPAQRARSEGTARELLPYRRGERLSPSPNPPLEARR